MNYYEELGIQQNATIREIRAAYKLVARLLHPDKQREARLKNLAESQMKRLGEMVAVLVNPLERARYDTGLAIRLRPALPAPPAPPTLPGPPTLPVPTRGSELLQSVVRHWFWALLGTMNLLMGLWYGLARGTDAPAGYALAESARAPGASVEAQSEQPRVKKPRVESPKTKGARRAERPLRDTVVKEPEPRVSATAPAPAQAPAEAAMVEQRGVPAVQKAGPADVARSGVESRFAGEWLYAAGGRAEDRAGTYPASYVEFLLREESGILAGNYRALHRVADKAISPEVKFRARGESPTGNTGKLQWETSAGAKGELQLTLRSPNQLQVEWWTTQFGAQEALSSGKAVLMRLKAP